LESFEKYKEKLVPRIETCKHSLTKTQGGQEANPQPLAWQTWNLSVRLPDERQLSDKMTSLFEPRHARRYCRICFEI